MLPPNTFIIPSEDRNPTHYYKIGPNQTFVFEFKVPMLGHQVIHTVHNDQPAQDWSISCWFSKIPLDCMLFGRDDFWNEHKMMRKTREYLLVDELAEQPHWPHKKLSAFPTYYFNIRNLQNQENTFKLSFSA